MERTTPDISNLKLVYLFSGNCSRQNSREKFLRLLGDLPTRRSLSLSSDHPPLLFGPKNFFPSPQTTPARGKKNVFRLLGANFGAKVLVKSAPSRAPPCSTPSRGEEAELRAGGGRLAKEALHQRSHLEVEMNFGANHPRHIQLEIGFRKKAQKARQAFGASPGGPGCACGSASGVPVGAPLGTWVGTRGALRGALHPKSLETSKTYETLGFLHPLRRANEARK